MYTFEAPRTGGYQIPAFHLLPHLLPLGLGILEKIIMNGNSFLSVSGGGEEFDLGLEGAHPPLHLLQLLS